MSGPIWEQLIGLALHRALLCQDLDKQTKKQTNKQTNILKVLGTTDWSHPPQSPAVPGSRKTNKQTHNHTNGQKRICMAPIETPDWSHPPQDLNKQTNKQINKQINKAESRQ